VLNWLLFRVEAVKGSEQKLFTMPWPRQKKSPSGTRTLGFSSPSQKMRSSTSR